MKWARLMVFITQLAVSVFMPLAGFVLLGLWLRSRFSLGAWVIIAGCVLGLFGAVSGLRDTLKVMEKMASEDDKKQNPVSFNGHE